MAMTGVVKDELSRVPVVKPCCRKAEVSTLLRFAGGLHLVEGRVVIEAELDTGSAARRLRANITEVFGHPADFLVLAPNGLRKGNRYVVRVSKGQAGESLARQTGLIDNYGRPVRGLPRQVVSGASCDCEAAWRGAFLAHGSLTEPGRSMALEITCPGSEAALALVGAARRLRVHAKARDVRGVDRVVIRDGEVIAAMLTRLGAHEAVLAWEERRMRREVRATANRLANFDDANLRRSARAAVAAGARVERALEILGPDAPDHLTMAGRLRMAHRQASLEELGQLAVPPLTKDAIAGRIRRLLAMADRRASDLGIPSTEACLTLDMLPLAHRVPAHRANGAGRVARAAGTRCAVRSCERRASGARHETRSYAARQRPRDKDRAFRHLSPFSKNVSSAYCGGFPLCGGFGVVYV
jgi:DNA-binding protein WhiA